MQHPAIQLAAQPRGLCGGNQLLRRHPPCPGRRQRISTSYPMTRPEVGPSTGRRDSPTWDPPGGRRVQPPLEQGPVDDHRAGELAQDTSVRLGARVDDEGAARGRSQQFVRRQPLHAGPARGQHVVDAHHRSLPDSGRTTERWGGRGRDRTCDRSVALGSVLKAVLTCGSPVQVGCLATTRLVAPSEYCVPTRLNAEGRVLRPEPAAVGVRPGTRQCRRQQVSPLPQPVRQSAVIGWSIRSALDPGRAIAGAIRPHESRSDEKPSHQGTSSRRRRAHRRGVVRLLLR